MWGHACCRYFSAERGCRLGVPPNTSPQTFWLFLPSERPRLYRGAPLEDPGSWPHDVRILPSPCGKALWPTQGRRSGRIAIYRSAPVRQRMSGIWGHPIHADRSRFHSLRISASKPPSCTAGASTSKMRIDLAAFQIGGKSNGFRGSVTLKELNFSFMLLGRFPCGEGPQVAPLAGFRILLAGIQAILSGLEFADHNIRWRRSTPISKACAARRNR